MKSIDKLNGAVAKQGKKIAQSNIGQKAINSGAGQKAKSAIDSASKNNNFVGNLTGYNEDQAFKAYDNLVNRSVNLRAKNPTFVANENMVGQARSELSAARDKALKNNRSLRRSREKMKSYSAMDMDNATPSQKKKHLKSIGKYDKKMNKATSKELKAYTDAKDQFKATDEFKAYTKLEGDRWNASDAYNKAVRDTRNSRRALTSGIIVGGTAVPGMAIHNHNKHKKQDEINKARSYYYY